MLINSKLGKLADIVSAGKQVDWLPLEWHETGKRIQRKLTLGGEELILKFLHDPPDFTQDDVLIIEPGRIVAIEIIPCDCLVIRVKSMYEMASLAYEIGNKHLPLYVENDSLLVPLDPPLLRLLTAQGYQVFQEKRKLLHPLRTTVSPHGNNSGTSLFSKIMQLTNSEK